MSQPVRIAAVADVPSGACKAFMVAGKALAVFNVGGTFYAIDDKCTHRGGPLSEGEVEGATVTCPWHAAKFDLTTGAALAAPASTGVKCYPVRIVGDELRVEMP